MIVCRHPEFEPNLASKLKWGVERSFPSIFRGKRLSVSDFEILAFKEIQTSQSVFSPQWQSDNPAAAPFSSNDAALWRWVWLCEKIHYLTNGASSSIPRWFVAFALYINHG